MKMVRDSQLDNMKMVRDFEMVSPKWNVYTTCLTLKLKYLWKRVQKISMCHKLDFKEMWYYLTETVIACTRLEWAQARQSPSEMKVDTMSYH